MAKPQEISELSDRTVRALLEGYRQEGGREAAAAFSGALAAVMRFHMEKHHPRDRVGSNMLASLLPMMQSLLDQLRSQLAGQPAPRPGAVQPGFEGFDRETLDKVLKLIDLSPLPARMSLVGGVLRLGTQGPPVAQIETVISPTQLASAQGDRLVDLVGVALRDHLSQLAAPVRRHAGFIAATPPVGMSEHYQHADGGLYRLLGLGHMKVEGTGFWVDAVIYTNALKPGPVCTTSAERWNDRFTPVDADAAADVIEQAEVSLPAPTTGEVGNA